MSLTDPYRVDTPELLQQSLGQATRARATHPDWDEPIELELERCQLSFDESYAPRVRAALTCRVPTDQSVLDMLDPRTGVEIEIDAGYTRPGGGEDVHTIARLVLRKRRVSRPQNLLELDAAGREVLVTDNVATSPVTPAQTTIAQGIVGLLTSSLLETPSFSNGMGYVAPDSTIQLVLGDDYWDAIRDLADWVDAQIYDDGLGIWRFDPRPRLAGESAAILRVGHNGTILGSDTGLASDDEWANAVLLKYEWEDTLGATQTVYGYADVRTGPYSIFTRGRRVITEERTRPVSQASANIAAAAVLARRLTHGRTFTLRAVSAYWLRPGMTVSVQLPTGPQERHLVSSVTFELPAKSGNSGWMQVTTRLPDNTTISTGE